MLSDILDGPTLFALGVIVLTGVFLRMAARRGNRRRIDKPHAPLSGPHVRPGRSRPATVQSEPTAARIDHRIEKTLGEMEVRLYDFDREVSARVETTLSTLDRLIEEADREISRLEELLARTEKTLPASGHRPALSAEDRRLVRHLLTAGYSTEEVAHLVGCTVAEVLAADTDSDTGPTRRAA